jgi:hypothetical protein
MTLGTADKRIKLARQGVAARRDDDALSQFAVR